MQKRGQSQSAKISWPQNSHVGVMARASVSRLRLIGRHRSKPASFVDFDIRDCAADQLRDLLQKVVARCPVGGSEAILAPLPLMLGTAGDHPQATQGSGSER
jgi:hypothetical protein